MFYTIGNLLQFEYKNEGKPRFCRIEKVKKGYSPLLGELVTHITGWDMMADYPSGGYRTFKVKDMQFAQLVKEGK